MSKDEARKILESFYCDKDMKLPIKDELVPVIRTDKPIDEGCTFHDYTFKGLIKIAYDLKDKL